MTSPRIWIVPAVLLAGLIVSLPALAQVGTASPGTQLDLQFRAGVNWTDNLGREAEGESETFGSIGTTVEFTREAARVRAALLGRADYFRYGSDRFDDEVLGRIDGLLGFSLLPQRLDWLFENRFGQVRADPFAAEAPGNRGYLNVFETGPDLYLPLGARTTLGGSARFIDRRWQDSDELDSQVLAGEMRLIRLLSPTQRIGLAGGMRSIDFDSADVPRYEVYSAYGTYTRQLAAGEVGLDLGANQLRTGGRSETGMLVRARWSRELTARSSLGLSAGREFQDAGDQLRGDGLAETSFGPIGAVGLAGDPYTRTYFDAVYALVRDRLSFGLAAGLERESYDTLTVLDREGVYGRVSADYRATPRLTTGVAVAFRREEFAGLGNGASDEWLMAIYVARALGRQFDLLFRYEYTERDADFGGNYEENRASLNIVWYPGRR